MCAGESDKDEPSKESAGAGEEERKESLPLSVDMDPLDPSLMPRPLLSSTVDSTSGSGLVGRTGEVDVTDTGAGLPVVGEGAGSREGLEGDEVGWPSPAAPSGSSVVSSQSVTTMGDTSLYGDVSQLEDEQSGTEAVQLDVVSKSLSSIQELLGLPEPDVSSAVSSSQSGGDVESFLSRIASGTPLQSGGDPVGSHTLEETLMSASLPETTEESGEGSPSLAKDDNMARSGGEDKEPSPDTQVEGSPVHKWPDVEDLDPDFSSAASASLSSSTPPDPSAPDPDWDSGQLPELLASHQTERERTLVPPLLGVSQLVQEAVSSSAGRTTGQETAEQAVLSEVVPSLPPQTEKPTTSGTHLASQPVDTSDAPTVTRPPPMKVLPTMKGVKLGVVKKRKEEDDGLGEPREEERLVELREKEGVIGSREKEGVSGLREEDGLGASREEEGPVGSLSEDTNMEEAEEEETPHDSSHRDQLVTSREQEGVVMWTQYTADVSVTPWRLTLPCLSTLLHIQHRRLSVLHIPFFHLGEG